MPESVRIKEEITGELVAGSTERGVRSGLNHEMVGDGSPPAEQERDEVRGMPSRPETSSGSTANTGGSTGGGKEDNGDMKGRRR